MSNHKDVVSHGAEKRPPRRPKVNWIEILDQFFNQTRIRYLGLGVLLAWVYCTWFSNGVFPQDIAGISDAVSSDLVGKTLRVSLLFSAVGLFSVAFRRGKNNPLSQKWVLASGLVMTCTTLMFLFLGSGPLILVDAALGGLVSSVLWVAWGELFCRIDGDRMEACIPASLVSFMVATCIAYLLPYPLAGVVISAFPLVSAVMLLLCCADIAPSASPREQAGAQTEHESREPEFPARVEPFGEVLVPLVKLALCSMVCATATGVVVTSIPPDAILFAPKDFILVYVAGAVLTLIISLFAIAHASRMNFSLLYEWAIPMIVISLSVCALVAACGAGMEGLSPAAIRGASTAALVLACASALYVEVLFYVIFVRITAHGFAMPSETFGIFRAAVQLGFLLGGVISAAAGGLAYRLMPMYLVMICLCVIMLPLFMHLQKRFDRTRRSVRACRDSYLQAGYADYYSQVLPGYQLSIQLCGSDSIPLGAAPEEQMDPIRGVVEEIASEYKLSPREAEVLGYLAKGRSVPYMRDLMVISKSTIETHIKHIYKKTGVHSRQEALDLIERYQTR